MRSYHYIALAAVLAALGAPAGSQTGSDSFVFLKAVRERDAATVLTLIGKAGSMVVNTRDRSAGEGALHYVVRSRDLEWLNLLLSKGARPDLQSHRGDTPLTLATMIGWEEGAKLLLDRGASVNLANGRGETPLILATQRRNLPMIRLLLGRRADPLKADTVAKMSALDYAKQDPRGKAVVKLLQSRP